MNIDKGVNFFEKGDNCIACCCKMFISLYKGICIFVTINSLLKGGNLVVSPVSFSLCMVLPVSILVDFIMMCSVV